MKKVLFLTDQMVSESNSEVENLDFTKALEGFYLNTVRDFVYPQDTVMAIDLFVVVDMAGKVHTLPPLYVKFQLNFWDDLKGLMMGRGLTEEQSEGIIKDISRGF